MALIDARKTAVAIRLGLHSSAGENFNSSLLTAAFNECAEFRAWIVRKSGLHGKLDPNEFSAESNGELPEGLRGRRPREKPVKRYLRPDILIWRLNERGIWDDLHGKKVFQEEARAKLHAVFVELKWGSVSREDCDKYVSFINKACENKRRVFMLIVSLKEAVKKRISKEPAYEWERSLHTLFNDKRVVSLTYDDVLRGLRESIASCANSADLSATHLAREYFEVLAGGTSRHYWEKLLEQYLPRKKFIFEIRDIIIDTVIMQSLQLGLISRYPKIRWDGQGNNLSFRGDALRLGYSDEYKIATLGVVAPFKNKTILFDLANDGAIEMSKKLKQVIREIASRAAECADEPACNGARD